MEIKKTYDVVSQCTIKDVLEKLNIKEQRLCVEINDEYFETLDENHELNIGDHVVITPEFQGGDGRTTKIVTSVIAIAAVVASQGIAAGPASGLTAGQAAGLRTAILVGSSLLIGGIQYLTRPSQDNKDDDNKTNRPDYSLNAGSNSVRVNGPLDLIMGTMRVFPDFSAKPYNEYRYAKLNVYETFGWQINQVTEDNAVFLLSDSITIGGVTYNFDYDINVGPVVNNWAMQNSGAGTGYYASRPEAESTVPPIVGSTFVWRTYVFVTSSSDGNPAFTNTYYYYNDLAENGANATPLPTNDVGGGVFEYQFIFYGYEEDVLIAFHNLNEVVKETLNYGYGDLVITDSKIVVTDSDDYRNFTDFFSSEDQTTWHLIQGEPNFSIVSVNVSVDYFRYVNGHVDTVDGGLLSNGDDFAYPNNWVLRKGPEKDSTFAIQIDIEGRIMRSDAVNGGVAAIPREFQFQYREVGTATWIDFPQGMFSAITEPYYINTVTLNNVYRETLWVDGLNPGNYEIQARKVDADEIDKDNVCEIYLKRVRFYQEDEDYSYLAQNRQSIIVNSSSQIYGTLDRLSSLVSAKCWAYDGTDYTWQETSNPADWFIYFARGGFLNRESDGSFAYPYSPTLGWQNSADHPDNDERIFGCGKPDIEIDFDSLQEWWQFCEDKDLSFNALLDSKRNPLEVLYEIAAAGRGSVTYTNGKVGVVWEDANQPVVALFTPDNIIRNSFQINYLNQKTTDKIIGQYIDAAQGFSSQNVEALVPGVTNPIDETTITLWGVTNQDQAQRAVNLLAARQLYQKRNVTWSTDAEGMMFSRGDVIAMSHDVSQWGYSGRITDLEYNATNILSFKPTCEVDESVTTVYIRNTHNEIFAYDCTVSNGRVVLVTPWLLINGPNFLDATGTLNAMSLFPDTFPDDFIFLAGNVPTPGKKLRIFEIKPNSMNRFDITAIDEENALYAHEFDNTYVAPENVERIKAKVFNSGFVKTGPSEGYITWDRDGCEAVSILISINGGAFVPYIDANSATIYSNQAKLYYGDGTNITAIISPVVVDVPFESIQETISFTV